MPSCYLSTDDLAVYGVPASTPSAAITAASTLVDAYLGRPEGLCYEVDAGGFPIAMSAKTPTAAFQITTALQPGVMVAATVQPAMLTADDVGSVWVIDQGGTIEAVVLAAVPTPGSVVLQTVKYAHAAQTSAQAGLTLYEERSLPSKRSVTRVAQTPVVSILSCQGRYTYGRRSDQIAGVYQDANLLAMVSVFGSPPAWNLVDASQVGFSRSSGELWVPSGALLAYFSEVKVSYIAGWLPANLPTPIKAATASLISSASNAAAFAGNMTSVKAGDTALTRRVSELIDPDIMRQLEPFKAKLFY